MQDLDEEKWEKEAEHQELVLMALKKCKLQIKGLITEDNTGSKSTNNSSQPNLSISNDLKLPKLQLQKFD